MTTKVTISAGILQPGQKDMPQLAKGAGVVAGGERKKLSDQEKY